jgi:hypothetical protein
LKHRERRTQRKELNQISAQIIAAALEIHSAIWPGVLESLYQTCMVHELKTAGLAVQSQIVLPVIYEGLHLDSGYRADLLVENKGLEGIWYLILLGLLHTNPLW